MNSIDEGHELDYLKFYHRPTKSSSLTGYLIAQTQDKCTRWRWLYRIEDVADIDFELPNNLTCRRTHEFR